MTFCQLSFLWIVDPIWRKARNKWVWNCKVGQEKFIGFDMLMNLGQEGYGDTYIQIPQFSDAYLYTGIQETNKEDADKSYKEYEKQAKKVKNGDSESFDAGGTRIYYSPDKNEVYCALSAKED